MIFGLFDGKGKKLVKKWEGEHIQIVELAGEVIKAYSMHEHKVCKQKLKELSGLASSHFMNEDLEFFKLSKGAKNMDAKTMQSIQDFQTTFKKAKIELMSFLSRYANPSTELDEVFFEDFNAVVGVVAERINYEEEELYKLLISVK